jgi:hypothetical protein
MADDDSPQLTVSGRIFEADLYAFRIADVQTLSNELGGKIRRFPDIGNYDSEAIVREPLADQTPDVPGSTRHERNVMRIFRSFLDTSIHKSFLLFRKELPSFLL